MTQTSPDIVCMGEPMAEFSRVDGADGRPVYLPGFGGDTSNCAIAAARQGASVGYVTRLGAEAFGDALVGLWRDEGIESSAVGRDPAAPTAAYFIEPTAAGRRFVYYRTGSAASRMGPADLPAGYIEGARYFHVSGISQAIGAGPCDAVFAAIEAARAAGVTVSYDTNLRLNLWPIGRARAVIHAGIARAGIALPSLEDATALTGLDDPDAIVSFYLGLGCPLVALKLGAEGALVAADGERRRFPPFRVDPVDTSGAGDTFAGAFLARLAAGDGPFAAARYANAAAALSTTGYGAVAPIPRADAVRAFLAERE